MSYVLSNYQCISVKYDFVILPSINFNKINQNIYTIKHTIILYYINLYEQLIILPKQFIQTCLIIKIIEKYIINNFQKSLKLMLFSHKQLKKHCN